jgi:hypothetical protein
MSGKNTPKRDINHAHHHHSEKENPIAIEYKGQVYYVEDTYLKYKLGDEWKKAVIDVSVEHPDGCTQEFNEKGCWDHEDDHVCGPGCGHIPVRHGDHIDYLVPDGRDGYELHHPHGDHCDHHGHVKKHKGPSQ